MMGVYKVVASVGHDSLSPNLHLQRINSMLDLVGFNVLMPSAVTPGVDCDTDSQLKTFGVSAFGISGTNACVLLSTSCKTSQQRSSQAHVVYSHMPFAWSSCPEITAGALTNGVAIHLDGSAVWQRTWPIETCNYLSHHHVGSTPVTPSSVFVQIACSCIFDDNVDFFSSVGAQMTRILFLDDPSASVTIRVTIDAESTQTCLFDVEDSLEWSRLAAVNLEVLHNAEHQNKPTGSLDSGSKLLLMTGSEFYAWSGNQHRGDFCSVNQTWLPMSDNNGASGHLGAVSKILFSDALHHGTMVPEEQQDLRSVAWLDACHQLALLAHPTYAGQPYLSSLSLEFSCRLSEVPNTSWIDFLNHDSITMRGSDLKTHANLHVEAFYLLKTKMLSVNRCIRHMYHTSWDAETVQSPTEMPSNFSRLIWDSSTHHRCLATTSLSTAHTTTLLEACSLSTEYKQVLICFSSSLRSSVQTANAILLLQHMLKAAVSEATIWLLEPVGSSSGSLGIAKSANLELSGRPHCIHVTMSAQGVDCTLNEVLLTESNGSPTEICVVSGQMSIPCVQHSSPVQSILPWTSATSPLLVTGGMGGIGLLVARWHQEHAHTELTLASRSCAVARGSGSIWGHLSELQSLTRIRVERCDLTNTASVAYISKYNTPNQGNVVHSAGVALSCVRVCAE